MASVDFQKIETEFRALALQAGKVIMAILTAPISTFAPNPTTALLPKRMKPPMRLFPPVWRGPFRA